MGRIHWQNDNWHGKPSTPGEKPVSALMNLASAMSFYHITV